jgi:hypothetical protein
LDEGFDTSGNAVRNTDTGAVKPKPLLYPDMPVLRVAVEQDLR